MTKDNKVEEAKKKAEDDYQGGGAYRAFLELFYKNKLEEDKENGQRDSKNIQNKMYYEEMQRKTTMASVGQNVL